MRLLAAVLVLALPSFAAKPVARAVRGSLDGLVVTSDSTGVVVRFLNVSKAEAQQGLDAVAKQLKLSGGLRIGFVKTQQSSLAALYFTGPGPLTVARLKDLAAACSQLKGATAAYAFVHPGPRNDELEDEAVWTFERGQLSKEQRISFRDDAAWVEWARKRLTAAELDAKKWPGWPLSALAVSLGLPGRDCLERPQAILELATSGFPRDVGENLVLTVVYLPEATLLEIRQLAETRATSPSKLVQDALSSVDKEEKLGAQVPTSGRAPWDEEMPHADKSPPRPLELFLTREIFNKLDARAADETASFSKLVEYAWRQANPFVEPKKTR